MLLLKNIIIYLSQCVNIYYNIFRNVYIIFYNIQGVFLSLIIIQYASENEEDFLGNNINDNYQFYNTSFHNKNNSNNNFVINQLKNEIEDLKKQLNYKEQIIMQQNSTIINLQNQLNNIRDDSQNMNNLPNLINQKEQEIISLKKELLNKEKEILAIKKNSYTDSSSLNFQGGRAFAISFETTDYRINKHPISCRNDSIIARLEEELYNEYPEYKDYNTYLTCRGTVLKRFKTIEENGIKKSDAIIVHIYE